MVLLCAEDHFRTRLVVHPKLGLSLADVRDITLREAVVLHSFLDLVDAKSLKAANELARKAKSGGR